MLQRVGHHGGTLDACSSGHVNFYGKLVTVGEGHHALWQMAENPATYDHAGHATGNCQPGMLKTLGQQLLVVLVENVEQVERLLTVCTRLRFHRFADEEVLQDRQ